MHTSAPGATITGPATTIQETLERGGEGEGEANKPRLPKTKHFNGNKTLHWKPYKETKHRNSVLQHSLLTLKIVCTVRHHFKIPVKYCVLAQNTSECRGPGANFGRQ